MIYIIINQELYVLDCIKQKRGRQNGTKRNGKNITESRSLN